VPIGEGSAHKEDVAQPIHYWVPSAVVRLLPG
jgi:hypothetical protein